MTNKKLTIKEIVGLLTKASASYYNSGKSLLTDKQFDEILDDLRKRSPKNKFLSTIGAPPARTRSKVKLPFYMGSLDKVKPDSADDWLRKNPGPYVVMDKQDGVAIALVKDGSKTSLFTRGNGNHGQDVSRILPYLSLPNIVEDIEIRAELQMSESAFEKYSGDFASTRNLVSGAINRLDIDPSIEDMDLFCYEILGEGLTKEHQLMKLKKLGFSVPKFGTFKALSGAVLEKMFLNRRSKTNFKTDGLVIELNKVNVRETSGNPDYAVGFKLNAEEDAVDTEVLDVLWSASKHGFLKPRVKVDPVVLDGVTVVFATGFNAKFIKDNGIGPGAIVSLVRSGDVIPHIVRVKRGVEPLMPIEQHVWGETGVDVILMDANSDVLAKKIQFFFVSLGVENFGPGLIKRFMEHGLDTIEKICSCQIEEVLMVNGVKETLGTKIVTNIRKALIDVDLPVLMAASGLFGRGVGATRLKELVEMYPDIMKEERSSASLFDLAMTVPGFSDVLATKFSENMHAFKNFAGRLPVTLKSSEDITDDTGVLTGHVVVFTGFRDKDLQVRIEQAGGTVSNSVTAKTTALVVKSHDISGSKVIKARKLGISIVALSKFVEKFRL